MTIIIYKSIMTLKSCLIRKSYFPVSYETCRKYSYKPIKRVNRNRDQTDGTKFAPSEYVSNKLKEFSLDKQLRSRIQLTGPITLADYMREVLTNPNSGYYMSKDVFGNQGDFITSPEIGQIFGELVAIWCFAEWKKCGAPKPFQIVELGPGRGTLIQDILRVFTHFRLSKEMSVHLVELSPFLSKYQSQNLCYKSTATEGSPYYQKGETVSGVKIYWYKRLEDVPNEFSILLAHEFFDALPIHKLQRENNIWKEVLIDIDPENQDKFRYVLSREKTPISVIFSKSITADEKRDHIEISYEADSIIQNIATRFEDYGGLGLIMDYGHTGEKSDTFRSFKNHQLHDPLKDPGTADLTADVDFQQIKNSCIKSGKLITFGTITQNEFLTRMEANIRLEMLIKSNPNPEQVEQLQSGYDMLSNPDKMGTRFKFLSLFPAILKDHLEKYPVAAFHPTTNREQ